MSVWNKYRQRGIMNKKILTASAFLAAASMSFGFETWVGDAMVYQINTELDAGGEKSGYWFNYGDDADGGASTITWPVPKGTEWSADALALVVPHSVMNTGLLAPLAALARPP